MLTGPTIGAFRLPLAAAGVVLLTGHAGAWTVSKAATCQTIGNYEYGHQVSIATRQTARNAYMTVVGKWQPSPMVTIVTIDTFGKGKVTVQRLCATDPWATGGTCTGSKVTQQTNPGWGLANVLSAAKDALAPKGLLPPLPAKVPVPVVFSEKWGGGGLPIAISVSVTGPRCARRYDEVRRPDGSIRTFGPTVIPANGKFPITQAAFQADFPKSGTYAIRSRIFLWAGTSWLPSDWSNWYQFPFAMKFGAKLPPGNVKQIPPPPPPKP
jgi:hypothetical protein